MQGEGQDAVVRQGYRVVIVLLALIVASLCLSPAYAQSPSKHARDAAGERVVGDKAGVPKGGPDLVRVKAGTPVTVLGLSRNCPECHATPVVQLPNGDVVILEDLKAIDYWTHTVRVDAKGSGPYTPVDLKEVRWLPGTGGEALLPLVGAVMLIGSGLVLGRLLR
jgi:hypothetical protein